MSYERDADEALCRPIGVYEPGAGSESELHDLLSAAGDACISFYMANHVSDMGARPQPEKKLWSIGQELYLAKQKGR
jgi:hypothetical protein